MTRFRRRSSAGSIVVAGRRTDGLLHTEVVDHRPGTGWMVQRLVEVCAKWQPVAVVIDAAGPAGSLIKPLESAGIEVTRPGGRDVAQAFGQWFDAVTENELRYLPHAALDAAAAGAKTRPLGDAQALARRTTSVDISPLVATTLAAWGLNAHLPEDEPDPQFWNWADLDEEDA